MLNILIVDDDSIERRGMEILIERIDNSMNIKKAKSGKEALELIKIIPFDIILTDIKMPNMSGLEFAKQALQFQSNAKIVVISAFSEFEYAKEALAIGASYYFLKPIDFTEFNEIIIKLINNIKSNKSKEVHDFTNPLNIDHLENKALNPIVKEVLILIEIDYQSDLSLSDLAKRVNITEVYLSTLFKKEIGIGLTRYLSLFRLLKSKELLHNISLKVSDISHGVGFKNTAYFCKLFKKEFGVTPAQYRGRI